MTHPSALRGSSGTGLGCDVTHCTQNEHRGSGDGRIPSEARHGGASTPRSGCIALQWAQGERRASVLFGALIAAALFAAPARAAETQLVHASTAYGDSAGKALKSPEGIACSEDGRVVVADTGNGRLVTYQFKNGALEGGTAVKLDGVDSPVRVELDSKGAVLALDRKSRRLVRVGADGKAGVVELKGVPAATGFVPVAFKLDRSDNLYVLDIASARIVVASGEGTFQRQLELPKGALVTDIAVDARGVVYAVDAKAAIVYSAQKGAPSLKPMGASLKGYMNFPAYVTASSRGGLVLVDRNGNGLVQLGPDGSYKGRQLSIGAADGFLNYPEQICVTSRGEIFVADRGNHRAQAFVAGK